MMSKFSKWGIPVLKKKKPKRFWSKQKLSFEDIFYNYSNSSTDPEINNYWTTFTSVYKTCLKNKEFLVW